MPMPVIKLKDRVDQKELKKKNNKNLCAINEKHF